MNMKAGFVRIFGSASIIAAAVSICSASSEAAPIPLLPDAIYSNVASVTEPNSLVHSQSTSSPTNGVLVYGANLNYNPPQHWIAKTGNDYQIPSLAAEVNVDDGTTGIAGSNLSYYVAFAGADGTVPVTIRANGSASLAPFTPLPQGAVRDRFNNDAKAFLHISEVGGSDVVVLLAESNLDAHTGGHLFSLDQQYMLKANTLYEVVMYADVYAAFGVIGDAFVDPSFIAPAGYTILTSAGIGNGAVATTPIPAALPLFASALGGLGLFGWRRRKAAARRLIAAG
jgi:hypothetical protein